MKNAPSVLEATLKVHNGNQKAKPTYQATQNKIKEFRICADLTKYYFDISENTQLDKFNKTLREILIYIGSKYTESGDIVCALNSMETIDWIFAQDRPIALILDAMSGLLDHLEENMWDAE